MSVLVLVPDTDSARDFVTWGHQFAVARGEPLRVLIPQERTSVVEATRGFLRELDPHAEILTLASTESLRSILTLTRTQSVNLIVASIPRERNSESKIGAKLLRNAPCDVVLLRPAQGSGAQCKKILVPTAGGPHAKAALSFASSLATDEAGVVTALYIAPPELEDPDTSGEVLLERFLKKAELHETPSILPRVVVADDVMDGIEQGTREDVDLILIGASNFGFIRRALFSSIPEKLIKQNSPSTVGVFRTRQQLWVRAQRRLDRILDKYVPQLNRETRISLYEGLNEGSQLSLDFVALISLSTAIASLGLMQDSGAVVIGAMLVAPLMTPMLGAGLGLVQGNIVLVRQASESILSGFFLSLVIGMFFGFTVPGFRDMTPELIARGSPNFLDLLIALLSGVAAAYAMARPGLLGALPGVAIAAALVPPIATAGIALSTGHTATAIGAAFLFGTNLVAIILASAITLYILGIRPNRNQKFGRLWSRRILVSLALTALFFAFPLGASLLSRFTERPDPLRVAIEHQLAQAPRTALSNLSIDQSQEVPILQIEVFSSQSLPEALSESLTQTARELLKEPHEIRIVTLLEWKSGPPP